LSFLVTPLVGLVTDRRDVDLFSLPRWIRAVPRRRSSERPCPGATPARNKSVAPAARSAAHRLGLVAAELVHDDDVARPQRWGEHLFDVGEEAFAV
jgi:hypothetical protein